MVKKAVKEVVFDEDLETSRLRLALKQKIDLSTELVQNFKEHYKSSIEPKLDEKMKNAVEKINRSADPEQLFARGVEQSMRDSSAGSMMSGMSGSPGMWDHHALQL